MREVNSEVNSSQFWSILVNSEVNSSKTGPKLSKTGTKTSKTGPKLSQTAVLSLQKPQNPQIPGSEACVLLPLGSPTVSRKRSYVHVPRAPGPARGTAVSRTCTAGGYQGGYTGWVYRVGIGGAIPVPHPAARGEAQDSGAGPGSPHRGLEWVVLGLGRTNGGGTAPGPPSGPGQATLWPSLSRTLRMPPPGHMGEIRPQIL